MRFITLITLRAGSSSERFVYGNALPHQDRLRETGRWRAVTKPLRGTNRLLRYTTAFDDTAFDRLHSSLLHGSPIRLPLENDAEATISARAPMVERGPVRASRADLLNLAPLLFPDEDHRTLWSTNPVAFYDELLGSIGGVPEQRAVDVRQFLGRMRELVPIPFDQGQFWRAGCFETIDCPVAGGGEHDVRVLFRNDRSPTVLRVELSGNTAEIATHIRLQANSGLGGGQRILDRVFAITGEPFIEVDFPEAGANVSIDVYGGVDGTSVCSRTVSRFTGFSISSHAVSADLPLEQLPAELRLYAQAGLSNRHPGISRVDPWATAQSAAVAYERRDFPARTPGSYMVHAEDQQQLLVRAFLASAGSGAVTIADPYFDAEALRLHLVGQRRLPCELTIVTSLDGTPEVDDDVSHETPDPAAVPQCTEAESSPLEQLLQAARDHHNELPRRLRIINVTSLAARNGKQFHDRFIRVGGAANEILWWLGNSLNSMGSRSYPLFAAEVSGQQRIEFGEYVRRLGEGNVLHREDAVCNDAFRKSMDS